MRIYIFIAAIALCITSQAQTYRSFPLDKINDKSNGIFYTLPQTELVFAVTLEKNIRHKGIFAQSAYLLGLKNVPMSDDTIYTIRNITLTSQPVAGAMYMLEIDGAVSVERNSFGALKSIQTGYIRNQSAEKETKPQQHPRNVMKREEGNLTSLQPVPIYEKRFLEKGMLEPVASLTAEKAVERIKTLREEQIKMLAEGVDGTYLNTTIDFMYKQLDEIINGYVAMFAGVEQKESEVVYIKIVPEKPIITEEDLLIPLCTFNEKEGIKKIPYTPDSPAKIDYGTIIANLHCLNSLKPLAAVMQQRTTNKETQDYIAKKGVGVYYVIPEKVEVSVAFGDINAVKTIDINQFGVVNYTLSNDQNLEFDRRSGTLISINNGTNKKY
ncbi:MAG: DUF4831 family protein [Bacteroidales bacterium]|jgi:hypothetical protein|nr:DUF4831 family protein [Bacteroidales bacterium]